MKNILNSTIAPVKSFFEQHFLLGLFCIALLLYVLPSLVLFVFAPYLIVPYLVMAFLVPMEFSPNPKDKPSYVAKSILRALVVYCASLSGILKKYFTAALTGIKAHVARNKWFYNPLLESLAAIAIFILIAIIAAIAAAFVVSPIIIAANFFPAYLGTVVILWFCGLYAIVGAGLPITAVLADIREFIQVFNIGKGKPYEAVLNCFFCFVIGLLIAAWMMSPVIIIALFAPALYGAFAIAFGAIIVVCVAVSAFWPMFPDANYMKQRAGDLMAYASQFCQQVGLEITNLCARAIELCGEVKGFMQEVFLTLKDLFHSVVMRKEEGKVFTQYKPLLAAEFNKLSPEDKIKDRITRAKSSLAKTDIFNVSDRKLYRKAIATLEQDLAKTQAATLSK